MSASEKLIHAQSYPDLPILEGHMCSSNFLIKILMHLGSAMPLFHHKYNNDESMKFAQINHRIIES